MYPRALTCRLLPFWHAQKHAGDIAAALRSRGGDGTLSGPQLALLGAVERLYASTQLQDGLQVSAALLVEQAPALGLQCGDELAMAVSGLASRQPAPHFSWRAVSDAAKEALQRCGVELAAPEAVLLATLRAAETLVAAAAGCTAAAGGTARCGAAAAAVPEPVVGHDGLMAAARELAAALPAGPAVDVLGVLLELAGSSSTSGSNGSTDGSGGASDGGSSSLSGSSSGGGGSSGGDSSSEDGGESQELPEQVRKLLPTALCENAELLATSQDAQVVLASALEVVLRYATCASPLAKPESTGDVTNAAAAAIAAAGAALTGLHSVGRTRKQEAAGELLLNLATSLCGTSSKAAAAKLVSSAVVQLVCPIIGSHLQQLLAPNAKPADMVLGAAAAVGTAALDGATAYVSASEPQARLHKTFIDMQKRLGTFVMSEHFKDAELWSIDTKRVGAVLALSKSFSFASSKETLKAMRVFMKAAHTGNRQRAIKVRVAGMQIAAYETERLQGIRVHVPLLLLFHVSVSQSLLLCHATDATGGHRGCVRRGWGNAEGGGGEGPGRPADGPCGSG